MANPADFAARAERMRAHFRTRYEQSARFREDRALASELTDQAAPLFEAFSQTSSELPVAALHDAFALLGGLCARAAQLGASASVAVTLPLSILDALRVEDVPQSAALVEQLLVVAAEAFGDARDQRSTADLRKRAADSQIALRLAPHCSAIFLAGEHAEADLEPVLERSARELLRDDTRSCVLDVRKLRIEDEDVRRMLGRFCAQALELGVQIALVTRDPALESSFRAWSLHSAQLSFYDDYAPAQQAALSLAGFEIHARRRWPRLFLSGRSRLVR